MITNRLSRLIVWACFFTFFSITAYLAVRLVTFILAFDYTWYEKLLALFLLMAETFILIHTTGYVLNILHVMRSKEPDKPQKIAPENYPPVAVVVASYKEPTEVIEETLTCLYNLSYPNKYLYLLDDTRYELPWDTEENKAKYRQKVDDICKELEVNIFRSIWHGAKAGKINDFLAMLDGNIRPDFQLLKFDTRQKAEAEKYMLVFDADMNPLPEFLEELVCKMEANPKAAFLQTPQYYSNFLTNRVACAAGLQQAIFYEYICEGKGTKGAMFCCGTNVLFRRTALMDVGGFDETSVTEDFATSLKLHIKGWTSIYVNKVMAFGLGPEDLGSYFKQQFRWARGTLGILMQLPKHIIQNFRRLPLVIWWEYFLPCTHYLIGFVYCIMIFSPMFYLFFNTPRYFANPLLYIVTYLPYFFLSSVIFVYTLKMRNYRGLDIAKAILINAPAFPVYMQAGISAMLNQKTSFGITPKGSSSVLSFWSLLPQLGVSMLCVTAMTWGLMRLYYEREPFYALAINIFWCFCNFCFMTLTLYFNHTEEY